MASLVVTVLFDVRESTMEELRVATRRIAAFDPRTRRWRTERRPGDIAVPRLQGEFVLAEGESGGDLGNMISGAPAAVLRPASAQDVAAVVAMCCRFKVPVAARGCHHTTHGQSLAPGGVAIEMTALNRIHGVTGRRLHADAGVTWRAVVDHAVAHGLRPATLPGYLELTLGGTLSVGGIGREHREGGFVERVVELEIVTGTGGLMRCSATRKVELFDAALGGLGQVGIITGVVLELLPAPGQVQAIGLAGTEHTEAIAAMRELMEREEIGGVLCVIAPPTDTAPPVFQVLAHSWLADIPRDAVPARGQLERLSYVDHVKFFDRNIEDMRRDTTWDTGIKPWFDVFLPDESVESFVGKVVPELTEEDWAAPLGFVLLHGHRRDAFRRPRLRVPEDTEYVWLFDLLTTSRPGCDPGYAERMLRRNERLWAEAAALGGVLYPIGSQDRGPDDWRRHYGSTWPEVLAAKRRYDPAGILTPGVRLGATGAGSV